MTTKILNAAAADPRELILHAVCAEAPVVPDGEGGVKVRAVVIPAPVDGVVPTRGGTAHRLSNPAQLAAALDAQEVDVRIDFDHASEPSAKTFAGSTAAVGWVSEFRAEANGAISALLALSAEAAEKLRRRAYRYLSPGLYLAKRGSEIVAMSSIALVNNPNMQLTAPEMHAADDGDDDRDAALQAREAAVEKREKEAEERALHAATAAVDRAIDGGRLLPAQKTFVLNAIQAHADGIEAGAAAFEAAHAAPVPGLDALGKRTAPRGAPPGGAEVKANWKPPAGYDVRDEDLALHAEVADLALKRNISYRDAVVVSAGAEAAPRTHAAPTGAQLAATQARIIDPVLTTAARGYTNAAHIAPVLFPRVTVTARGGERVEFDRTDFRKVNSRRARGAGTARVRFGHEGAKFALEQHRLEGALPVEDAQEAMAVPGIDLGMRTVDGVQALVSLAREIHAGELASDQANYHADHVLAVAAGSKWNEAGSNPTRDVINAVEKIRSKTGKRATTVVLGPQVFAAVSIHPLVLQQIRYAGGKQIAEESDLARMWRVQNVVVGDAIWVDDADVAHDVWGNVAIVAYTPIGTLTRYEPSFGHGYTLAGTPLVETPYHERNPNSWLYPVCEEWSNEIVGQDAGYLIRDVIET